MPNGEADPAPQVAGDSTVGDDLRKLIQGEKQTAEPQAIGTDLRALVQGKAEPDQYGFLNIDTIMGGGAQEQDAPSDDSAAPAPSPEPEQYGFLDIGMVSGGESTTPSMADHEAAAKKQGQRIEPMGNLLSNHLPTGAKAVMTPEAWETRRRMMKALTDIGIDPVESSTNYIPLLGGFELTDGQYNERLMAQFKEAFRLPDTASITQLQEIEDRIAMSQAHSIINLYRQDMAENPDDPFHAHDLILAPYAPMPLDPDDPEKGLVYPDLPDAEQSRAFMEAINARRELGDQDTHVFIAALYDRALRGLTFDKIGVGNALEAAESVFGDGMTAEDAEMFQRMMAKAVDERGFAGALAAEGANFLPALIPIGKLAGGVRAGAMKAGMSAAAAQKLATPLSLALYGGIAAEGDVEDRLKAAGTSAAFGIVSPAIANRVSDALRRFPSFIQHGAAEAIGFMGASAAVHGGEVSGQQALMDGILGGFLGVLSNRSGRVAKGNARDATRNVRDAAERAEVLLGHDWTYRVERVEDTNHGTVISLRHVPEPAKAQDATVRGEPQRQAQEAIEVAEATEPAIKPIEGTASEKIDLDGLARDIEAFSGAESPDATRPLPRQAGAVDITEVPKLPWKLARKITGKTRDAVEAINRVGNNLVRLSFTGNAEAVKFLASQAGRIPGVSGLVQRGRAAAEAAKLRLDGLQTGRVFNDALAEMEYGKDLAALQSDATVHTFAKVPTGERGILGRKKYRPANDFEMANVNAFLEGQVTAEQMRDRGVHEDLIREAERGRKLRLDNHEALHKAGLISDESYRSYKEVGPTRTDYSEFLEAELADPGSGGLKVPKNELKRDAAVTVTWKDGGRKRHRKFFARDHGGWAINAQIAAEKFYNELKSAAESGDRNRARKVLGDDAVEVEMTDLGRRLTGTEGRITDVESLPQERRGDKIEHPAFRHSRTLMLQEAMLGRRRMQQRLAADPSQVRSGKKVRQPDGSFKWEPPDDLPENFNPVPIPDDPRYGPLAGKFVRQGIRGEIEGQFGARNGAGWAALKAIDAATSQWKIGKTIANPATHARNMMGNVFFAELAGLSFMRPEDTQHFLDAMKVLRARKATDPGFNLMAALTKMGVGRNNGISNEAGALMDYITRLEGRSMKSRWEQMWADARKGRLFEAMGGKGFDLARAAYEFEDVVYKVAYALQQLRKGKTLAEAGRLTNRYFPNYNQNPAARAMQGRSLGKHLARASFLPPFLSFTAEAMRIMSVHSVERPFSLAMGTTLLSGITKAAMESLGLTDEDMKRLRENGPSWSVPGSAVVPLLPWVDSDGKLRVIDTQFINPGAEFFLAMEALTQGKKAPALGGRGETGAYLDFINNPVLAPVQDLFRNQSRFFGSDIVPEGLDDPAMRWEHRLKYLLESWAPSFTPGVGRSFQRLKEGVTGETIKKGSGAPNRHGDTRGLFEAVADTIGGLRTRPINPTREQQEALRSVGFRMMAKKRALRSALRRGDEAEADQIRQEMRELAAEAERMGQPLSENLLRFDPEAEK